MELKPGYKQTEVGVIPEEWEVKAIAEFAEVKGGKRLPLGKSLTDKPTPHPYLRVTDMRFGGVALDDIKYVPEDVFPAIKNYRISSADIFISVAGTLGIVGKVPPELDGANLTENADKIANISCDRDFLLYDLMSHRIQRIIEAEKTVGAQPKLALARIGAFRIGLPKDLPEQRAIAVALSDVDALIGALDRLIAKKRDLKQAAMQQLLTGQSRLPGFSGEWEVKRFGDAATPRKDRVDPRRAGGQEFCVELEHIEPATGQLLGSTATGGESSLKSVFREGDVLFGKLRAYLRKYWLADCSGVCSTEIWVFVPNKRRVTAAYLFQFIKMDQFIEAASTAYGTHMPRSDWTVVKNYELRLPPLPEQTAIATVLSDMDCEIAALEQRRNKTRDLKQGMMQELLTGRTRLGVRSS